MKATRREFLTASFVAVVAPLASEAQRPEKLVRVGYLVSHDVTPEALEAFRKGLRDFGWREGRDVLLEIRSAEGDPKRLPALAAELVRLPVDVLVASAAPASLAAKQATSDIPIVSVYTLDPVQLGLAASLARPGGNITGLSTLSLAYASKMLELLRSVVPNASSVAVLGDPSIRSHAMYWKEFDASARTLRLTLNRVDVSRPADLERAIARISPKQSLLVMHQPFTFVHRKQIVKLAAKHRLPTVYGTREAAEDGGLIAFGPSLPAIFHRAAAFVDRIIKGAKPADLPIEQPTKFELVINLKTAKALGLTIPPSLLLRADQVIE